MLQIKFFSDETLVLLQALPAFAARTSDERLILVRRLCDLCARLPKARAAALADSPMQHSIVDSTQLAHLRPLLYDFTTAIATITLHE